MKVLAVDTATKSCSVAVVSDEQILAEMTILNEQTHSKHLMDLISSTIKISGLELKDLDGFAVTRGPGSFTGLRIGISTVKGLAAASEKPIVGISTLNALASQFSFSPYLICPVLDARKNEVYCSTYRFTDTTLRNIMHEQVLSLEQAISNINETCLFIGDGVYANKKIIIDKLEEFAKFAIPCQNVIRASSVALLGISKIRSNNTENTETFIPNYIRKSEAELKKESNQL